MAEPTLSVPPSAATLYTLPRAALRERWGESQSGEGKGSVDDDRRRHHENYCGAKVKIRLSPRGCGVRPAVPEAEAMHSHFHAAFRALLSRGGPIKAG